MSMLERSGRSVQHEVCGTAPAQDPAVGGAHRVTKRALLVVVLCVATGCSTTPASTPSPSPAPPTPTPLPTSTPTPLPTAAPTLRPTATPIPTLAPMSVSPAAVAYIEATQGYELSALPATLEGQLAQQFAESLAGADPTYAQAILGYAARSAAIGGDPKGLVFGIEFEPGWTTIPGALEGAVQGMNPDDATRVTIAGRPAYLVDSVDGTGVIYLHGNLLILVFGTATKATQKLAAALITANA
jgi:hypothetical protein